MSSLPIEGEVSTFDKWWKTHQSKFAKSTKSKLTATSHLELAMAAAREAWTEAWHLGYLKGVLNTEYDDTNK